MTPADSLHADLRHAARMDAIYRHQRHIYDLTRKYYLLGRDRMVGGLEVPSGGRVLELGCGTGRNLSMMQRLYPGCRLFGLDISEEMLITARRRLSCNGGMQADLIQGDASCFDARSQFGEDGFERIVLSYALSMIPQWRETIGAALSNLAPGGSLHIVDFGGQEGLPKWFGIALRKWLARFDVTPRSDLDVVAARLAGRLEMASSFETLFRGYAQIVVIRNDRHR